LDDDEAFVVLQKAAKFQNPAHPDTQLNYVREHFLRTSISAPLSSPAEIPIRLCHVRYLFQRAVSLSGSGSSVPVLPFQRDYSTAFHALAFEWTQFERQFGSPESQSRAHKTIQRKLEKFDTTSLPTHRSYTNSINATRAEANIVVEAWKRISSSKLHTQRRCCLRYRRPSPTRRRSHISQKMEACRKPQRMETAQSTIRMHPQSNNPEREKRQS